MLGGQWPSCLECFASADYNGACFVGCQSRRTKREKFDNFFLNGHFKLRCRLSFTKSAFH